MAGKVFHVSDSLHHRIGRFCDEAGLRKSDWVASILERALEARVVNPEAAVLRDRSSPDDVIPAEKLAAANGRIAVLEQHLDEERARKRPIYDRVPTKRLRKLSDEKVDDVYSRPAFWERNKDAGENPQDDGEAEPEVPA